MNILQTTGWNEYALLDSGNGLRLEQFGPYTTVRPDPQAIWQPSLPQEKWNNADVLFKRTTADSGKWIFRKKLPEKWLMHWKDLSFWVYLSSFKHTGVFPEQSLQWEFIQNVIANAVKQSSKDEVATSPSASLRSSPRNNEEKPSVLNLFGYTGIASLAAVQAGAKVTHVDASKPTIAWARENQKASGLSDKPIRWILDDAVKFAQREVKRGNTYDAIIMDPPVYGHGPTGQVWKFSESFPQLMQIVSQLLSPNPLFVLVNAYAISSSALMLENVLKDFLPQGTIDVGELVLEEKISYRPLSTGIFARWH